MQIKLKILQPLKWKTANEHIENRIVSVADNDIKYKFHRDLNCGNKMNDNDATDRLVSNHCTKDGVFLKEKHQRFLIAVNKRANYTIAGRKLKKFETKQRFPMRPV